MPTLDYTCQRCGHSFQRVVLGGEETPPAECPCCKAPRVEPARGAPRLFNGIAPFSRLARDTN